MRITVNTNGEQINGILGTETYSVVYSKDLYDSLMALSDTAEAIDSVEDMKGLIKEGLDLINKATVDMEATKNPYLFFNKKTNTYHLKWNNTISKLAIPQVLVDRIILSMDKGIDYMPVVKMIARLFRNKKVLAGDFAFLNRFANYVNIKVLNPELKQKLMDEKGFSADVAHEMAKMYSIQITKEGMLLCYKVSREITHKWELDKDGNPVKTDLYPTTKSIDPISGLITYSDPVMPNSEERLFEPAVQGQSGDAFYCLDKTALSSFDGDFSKFKAAHLIKVGCIVTHDSWDKVNCNDHQSCVKGLHVGGLDYIRGYQDSGTQTHNVVVDPMDIGAICDDNTGAMRVLRYFVQDVFGGVNNSIYHSSTYSKFTDAEFDRFVKKTVEDLAKSKAESEELEADYLNYLASFTS